MIVVGLGSNLGDKRANIANAVSSLLQYDIKVEKKSSLYFSKAWGITAQDNFLNQVIFLNSAYSPFTLLSIFKKIEQNLGRRGSYKWGPRIIDIDLLYYYDKSLEHSVLKVPHPYLTQRIFVLLPWYELTPNFIVNSKKIAEWLEEITPSDFSHIQLLI